MTTPLPDRSASPNLSVVEAAVVGKDDHELPKTVRRKIRRSELRERLRSPAFPR
jgi:hypothetical protein